MINSDQSSQDPGKQLKTDSTGGVWVDYIADTGDGFQSTYTMAYMLAREQLEVRDAGKLPRGEVLIFGGDQAYPQATHEEYQNRFVTPLDWAHTSRQNRRKAFAIPGNHDWYDGLAAFDSLFCAARGNLADNEGTTIGGWDFAQHRSYWAMKLPHNWWIWGADIQFSNFLDNAQVNYFEAIADHMNPSDDLIICLAEPAWLIANQEGIDNEENLFKLVSIARRRGINISAVIAGDWHHYNRYHAVDIGAHFFTAGGGGAFMHSTQTLSNDFTIPWPKDVIEDVGEVDVAASPPEPAARSLRKKIVGGKGVGAKGEQWSKRDVGMKLREKLKGPPPLPQDRGAPSAAEQQAIDSIEQGGALGAEAVAPIKVRTSHRAPKCYPSKATSMMLSLKNLWFPLNAKGFAALLGVIYWLITWSFHAAAKSIDIVQVADINNVSFKTYFATLKMLPIEIGKVFFVGPAFIMLCVAMLAGLVWYVHATANSGFRRWFVKLSVGLAHFSAHLVSMFVIFLLLMVINNTIAGKVKTYIQERPEVAVTEETSMIDKIIEESLAPLSNRGAEQRKVYDQITDPTAQTRSFVPREGLQELKPLAGTTARKLEVKSDLVRDLVGLLYPLEMIVLGGLVGGFIWGLYWIITGLLGGMHTEDAFAALGIKNHKNFLRMRFDADKVTIYPIGLDKVPGRFGWRSAPEGGGSFVNRPKLIATPELQPELIEEPIVIYSKRHTTS